ncbi:restriction endonuclease subunit S [Capnocytophaga leadbetteri]|uniref:restriction endonuclease subunit S n=1 Tax=Capnocytophaga leadbetteri TaxID=327575 RepID=UPI0028E54D2F|nr:restriction endonuclease subunit S [Capnocytophaga leadbetteri]
MSKAPKLRFPEFEGEWEEKKVIDTFKIMSIRNIQIKNSEIKKKGKYKVVDQGKDLVAGFSDKNNTFKNVPIIIFGDHTTIIKYIDFEFIVGADGVKILTNKNLSNNLKYLFYNLQQNNVEQEGYKRHFSLLSERYLQIPLEQNEQQKIADCLSALDEEIAAEEEALEALKAYKKGLLQQMFVN